MASVAFDTLKFVQTLESAGMGREQASAIAAAVRDTHDAADVATKGDVRNELALLRTDMAAMELRVPNALTLRAGAMVAAGVGVLLAVLPMLISR